MNYTNPFYVIGGKQYTHNEIVTELKKRIRKGRRWARDRFGPRYYTRIDNSVLNMESSSTCILGQIFGNYWDGLNKIFPGASSKSHDFALSHGFIFSCINDPFFKPQTEEHYLTKKDIDILYTILGDLWVEQLNKDRLKYGD